MGYRRLTLAWRDGVPADAPADIHGIKDALADPDLLLWADIVKPTHQDLILLAEELGVGRNALEDAVAPYERPKASQEDGYQYFVTYATLPGFASTAGGHTIFCPPIRGHYPANMIC